VSGSAPARGGSAIDLPTLVVTALASAVAAYVTSKIWAAGTLAAAAFTPVLVAVLKEAFAKPVEVVTRAVPVRGVVRSSSGPDEDQVLPPAGSLSRDAGAAGDTPEAIEARIAQLGEAPGLSRPGRRRAWQIAVVTGLLGFLVAAVIITVPELIAGGSVSGGGRETTLFSTKHSSSPRVDTTTTDTTTETTPTDTDTTPLDETITVPQAKTVTVPPPAVTVPQATTPVDPGTDPTLTDTVPAEPPPP
jgi:hypothetical protein